MGLRESLQALVMAAPPDATVPVRWISELLVNAGSDHKSDLPPLSRAIDMTVTEVAAHFGRGESTIRAWLARGDLPGAYRLHGREWRIPPSSIQAMQNAQRQIRSTSQPVTRTYRTPDIAAWRGHIVPAPQSRRGRR